MEDATEQQACVVAGDVAKGIGAAGSAHVMCISPYPHYRKDRPTNPCLYWVGQHSNDSFNVEEASGLNIAYLKLCQNSKRAKGEPPFKVLGSGLEFIISHLPSSKRLLNSDPGNFRTCIQQPTSSTYVRLDIIYALYQLDWTSSQSSFCE